MPFADEVAQSALDASKINVGAMFGQATGLGPGAGLVYSGFTYPIFNPASARYEARTGSILILTHECDVEQANVRDFNTEFIFLPLMTVFAYAAIFDEDDNKREQGRNLAASIAAGRVNRLTFLPPIDASIPLGECLHFNAIASSHISQLGVQGVQALCALSEYGLSVLDRAMQNHLF